MTAFQKDEVHIWRAPLDVEAGELVTLEGCLSEAEAARAIRFRFQHDRARWIASRGWLRHLLGTYLGEQPADLEFVEGANGKPRLTSALGCGLNFSVSHSGSVAVYAVAYDREVGVDIELVDDDFPMAEVARRSFTNFEQAVLAALPVERQARGYFECWTLKEALLKGIGTGWAGADAHLDAAVDGWSVYGFAAGPDYVAAVAVAGRAYVPLTATPLQLPSGGCASGPPPAGQACRPFAVG